MFPTFLNTSKFVENKVLYSETKPRSQGKMHTRVDWLKIVYCFCNKMETRN